MTFYTEMATVARELLTEFGQQVTITQHTGEQIDPETFDVDVSATETAVTPYGILTRYDSREVDGTRIQMDDRLLILDDSYTPKMDDLVTIGGEQWNIISWETKNPAGTPLVYFVQVRR